MPLCAGDGGRLPFQLPFFHLCTDLHMPAFCVCPLKTNKQKSLPSWSISCSRVFFLFQLRTAFWSCLSHPLWRSASAFPVADRNAFQEEHTWSLRCFLGAVSIASTSSLGIYADCSFGCFVFLILSIFVTLLQESISERLREGPDYPNEGHQQ